MTNSMRMMMKFVIETAERQCTKQGSLNGGDCHWGACAGRGQEMGGGVSILLHLFSFF